MHMNRGLALGALLILGCGAAGAAGLDGQMKGAWATSTADCKKLFVRQGGGYAFRRPIDQFAQAAIIGAGEVILPNQTCRVVNSSRKGGVMTLDFDCRDTISYTSQSVEVEIKSGSEMIYRPNGDKTLDTVLIRCGS